MIENPVSVFLYPRSPSARRAWIEILYASCQVPQRSVALREEGVDRNVEVPRGCCVTVVALREEGVDRNLKKLW